MLLLHETTRPYLELVQLLESKVRKSIARLSDVSKQERVELDAASFLLHDWYDGLAYCTYNSLGIDLRSEKIISGLDSLASNGINVSTFIIDDNWQIFSGKEDDGIWRLARGWERFEANGEYFPNGLRAAVDQIRERYPVIKDIAVRHVLLGYWGGISPTGPLAKKYKTLEVDLKLMDFKICKVRAIHPDDAHKMYDDFYTFLSFCGITAVKTDVQCQLDNLVSTPARASFTTAYQSAWTTAYLRHFKGKAISCMSMVSQIIFHSFL